MKNTRTQNRWSLLSLAFLAVTLLAFQPRVDAAPYCMVDGFGYTYSMNVTPAGGGVFNITGSVAVTEWSSPGVLSGTYNRNTNTAILTVTNPAPDGCVLVSGSFTLTGSRSGGTLFCSWTNDCGGSGSVNGSLSKGACRFGPTASSVPGSPGTSAQKIMTNTLQLMPNPATTSVRIQFEVDADQVVRVDVMDMTGRTVAVLADGFQEAGVQTLNWDLTNAHGAAVANGLYLVRINNTVQRLHVQR